MNLKRIEEPLKILLAVLLIIFILKIVSERVSFSKGGDEDQQSPTTETTETTETAEELFVKKIKSLNNLRHKEIYPGISGDLDLVKCKGKEDLTCGVSLYSGDSNPSLRRYSIIDIENDKVVADSVPTYFLNQHTVDPSYVQDNLDDYDELKEHAKSKNYKYAAMSTTDKDNFDGYIYLFNDFKNMDSYVPTLPGIFGHVHEEISGTESAKSISDCVKAAKDTYDVVGFRDYDHKSLGCFGYKGLNDNVFPILNQNFVINDIDTHQLACTNGKNIGGSNTKTCSV